MGQARRLSLRLQPPSERLIKPAPELQVVGGVDDAVAVEVEERLVAAAGGLVEGGAEGEVVAGIEDRLEIGSRRSACRRTRSIERSG
jgi:hypothetical protein